MTTTKPAPRTSLAHRLRQSRSLRRGPGQEPVRAAAWNPFKAALVLPSATTLVLAVLITVTKLLAGGTVGGLATEVSAGWLTLNQVPLTISGVTVGALPLLPTLIMMAAVARVVARAARDVHAVSELTSIAAAALAGPLLFTALALAMVADGSAVTTIGQAPPLPAFGSTVLVQAIGVAVAVAPRLFEPLVADRWEIPACDRMGGRAGLLATAALVGGAAVVVTLGLFLKWGRVGDLIASGHSFGGYVGLTALSILYLPNVVLAALGVAVGGQAEIGSAAVSALGVHPGTVPPIPVLGLLPETSYGNLGLILFVIPAAVGVWIGWYCRSDNAVAHLRAVGVAAAVSAGIVVGATVLGSGSVGELGSFGVPAAVAGMYTFAWIAVAGALVAGIYYLLPANRSARRGEPFDLDALLGDDLEIVDDDELDWFDDEIDESDLELADDLTEDASDQPTEVLDAVDD